MYTTHRSKSALFPGETSFWDDPWWSIPMGRKTVANRGPNSPRFLWIAVGAPHCETLPVELPLHCPLVVRLMFHAPISRYIRRQQAIDQHH